jgi:hypothetical protein
MRIPTLLLAATCAVVPAAAALAAPVTTPASLTVARYTFDGGQAAGGAIADQSGRGMPLRVRSANGGAASFITRGTGRAVAFPARCAPAATTCRRIILEGGDDADLDPGTRAFRFGAYVRVTAAQVGAGANVMQKGVANTQSQWKMQIGGRGKPNCVLVGRGSTRIYLARASVRITDGAWHSVGCSRAGATLTIYVDGTARGSVSVPSTVSVGNALPLRLGGRNLNSRSDQFGGALDEVYAVLG